MFQLETARAGEPVVAANAARLQVIAWMLLSLQCLSIVIGAIARSISTTAHPINVDAGSARAQRKSRSA